MTALLLAFLLIALGLVFRWPARVVLGMLAVLWAGVVVALLVMPEDHPMRGSLGGDWRPWAFVALVVLAAALYRAGLLRLRQQARARSGPAASSAPADADALSEVELDRYARHIVLREIGGMGQRRLKQARVLVVGAGGLGSPALLYLAAAGVGRIGVIDDDVVSHDNLQRQVIHADRRIGQPKVFSAQETIRALNPFVEVRPYHRRLVEGEAVELISEYDIVLDGSDNFPTRHLVNAAAVAAGKPLIAAAITQWEGQISLYDPARDAPCYACIFPEPPARELIPSCAEAGVLGALPGVLGAMMAVETIKEITGAGQTLRGRLLIYDALYGESRQIAVRRSPACPVCGGVARRG